MATFWDLTKQQTAEVGISDRYLAYNGGDTHLLGDLPKVDFVDHEVHGLGKASHVSSEVAVIVDDLKAQGILPSTTRVDFGNSHVVVSLSRDGEDDIFAIYDVNK